MMRSEPESLGLRGLGLCGHLEFYTREFYPVIPSDVMVFPSCPPVTSAGGRGLLVVLVWPCRQFFSRPSSPDGAAVRIGGGKSQGEGYNPVGALVRRAVGADLRAGQGSRSCPRLGWASVEPPRSSLQVTEGFRSPPAVDTPNPLGVRGRARHCSAGDRGRGRRQ